jgi:hypothetical protein
MTSSTNNNVNSLENLEFINRMSRQNHKGEEKQEQQLLQLANMMTQIESILTSAGKDGSTSSDAGEMIGSLLDSNKIHGLTNSGANSLGDATGGSDAPSAQDITDYMAALQKMMNELEKDKAACKSDAEKRTIEIIEAQLKKLQDLLKALQALQDLENKAKQGLTDFLKQEMARILHDLNEKYDGWKVWDWGDPDPDTWDVVNLINNFFQATFGFNPGLNGDNYNQNSLNQIITDAMNALTVHYQAQINKAAEDINDYCMSTGNPVLILLMRMMENGQKISDKDMQNLSKVLEDAINMLSKIGNLTSGDMSEGPSDQLMVEMLALMKSLVGQLQNTITEVAAIKAKNDSSISSVMIQSAIANLAHLQAKIETMEEKQKEADIFDKIIDAVTVYVTANIVIFAIITGQTWLAAVAVAVCVAQLTGAFEKLADKIAEGLEDCGVSKDTAEMIGKWAVVAITVIVCLIAGNIGSAATTAAEAGTTAAEEAGSMELENVAEMAGTDLADSATNSVTQAAENASKNALQKVFSALGKLNPFRYLSATVNTSIDATIQSMMGTNAIQDTIQFAMKKEGKTDEEIQNALNLANIIINSVCGAICLLSADGAMNSYKSIGKVAEVASEASRLARLRAWLAEVASSPNMLLASRWIERGADAAMIGANTGLAVNKSEQAELTSEMAENQANIELFEMLNKVILDGSTASTKSTNQTLKHMGEVSKEVNQEMLAGQAAFAQLFSQAV